MRAGDQSSVFSSRRQRTIISVGQLIAAQLTRGASGEEFRRKNEPRPLGWQYNMLTSNQPPMTLSVAPISTGLLRTVKYQQKHRGTKSGPACRYSIKKIFKTPTTTEGRAKVNAAKWLTKIVQTTASVGVADSDCTPWDYSFAFGNCGCPVSSGRSLTNKRTTP